MKSHKTYLLWLLTVILTFNYMDRIALGVVLQDIKVDLHLSDTQLGFLSGIAFALFYALLGVPIARWADRGNRVTIITLSVALWSIAVALSGVVASFAQLMLIRVLVGVGESGCVPASLSLIAGCFTRDERPRAVSFYMQGISVSLLIGYFAAGWLDQVLGWRILFAILGLPGLGLALLAVLTVKDPRSGKAALTTAAPPQPSFKEACAFLWGSTTFRHLLCSLAVSWFFSYGALQWTPAFFVRSFGMKTGELGSWLAALYGVAYLLGTYWGGEWATRHAVQNERRQLQAMAIITAISGGLAALVYIPTTAPNAYLAFAWLGLSTFAGAAISGPQFAVIQALVPPRMQAVAVAMVYLFGNLVGLGLGPWVVGALSDALHSWWGPESLRYALLCLCPAVLWSAWHLWAAVRTVTGDMDRAHSNADEDTPHGAAVNRAGQSELVFSRSNEKR